MDRRVPRWVVEGVAYDELVHEVLRRALELTPRHDPLDTIEDPHLTDGQHALLAIDLVERARMAHGWYAAVRAHRPLVVAAALWGAERIGAGSWGEVIQAVVDEVFGAAWPLADDELEDACWARFDRRYDAAGEPNPSHPDFEPVMDSDFIPDGAEQGVVEVDEVGPIFRWAAYDDPVHRATALVPGGVFDGEALLGDLDDSIIATAESCPSLTWDADHEALLETIVAYVVAHPEELFTDPAHGREDALERIRYLDELLAEDLDDRGLARATSWSDGAIAAAQASGKRGLQRAARLQREQVDLRRAAIC